MCFQPRIQAVPEERTPLSRDGQAGNPRTQDCREPLGPYAFTTFPCTRELQLLPPPRGPGIWPIYLALLSAHHRNFIG